MMIAIYNVRLSLNGRTTIIYYDSEINKYYADINKKIEIKKYFPS